MTHRPELLEVWEYCATNKDAGTSTFFRLTFRDETFRDGILWTFGYERLSAKDGQGGIIDCADERARDLARAPVASSHTEPDKKRRTRSGGRTGNFGAAAAAGAKALSDSLLYDNDSPPPGSNSTHCRPDGLGGYNCTSGSPGNESTTHCYPDGLGGFVCEEGY
jgi:hypothetical protein